MHDPNALYSVEIIGDIPDFIVLGVCVQREDDWVGFHDTGRGHHIEGRLDSELPNGFIWQRIGRQRGKPVEEEKIIFRVLTLDDFKRDFMPEIYDLPEFKNTQELHEWYRRQYADRGSHY